jgi:hypothetical protein
MNLTSGSMYSWEELCARFTANFASAYQQHGVEAHLHAVRQEPGETLWAFISRFTKVRGTIPRIFDASIITAFRQGVRDEKMLEKLATHDVETITTLFALANKCARAAEGRAWHSAPQTGVAQTGGSGAVSQDGKKKKKKNRGHERPQSAAPVVATATGGRNERNKRPRPQGGNSGSCPMHPNSRHGASECREIIKLVKRVSERREQTSKEGSPPRRWPGKERVDDSDVAVGDRDLGYQSPEQVLKDILTGDSDSSDDNDHHKKLYVMYGGSWELTSRRNVKSLCREVLSATPGVPRQPHTSGGGAPPSPSGHPTAPRTCQGPAYCAHHRPYHCQHQAASCSDRRWGWAQRHQPRCVQAAADPKVPTGTLSSILRSGRSTRVSP